MIKLPVSFVVLAVLACGCTTVGTARREETLRQANEMEIIKRHVTQLENRVDDMETGRQRLYDQNDALRAELAKENQKLRDDLAAVQALVKAVDTARARDRQEIVDILTRELTKVLREQRAALPAFQEGREHTVQEGETLSEIAKAYKVTVAAIVKANKDLKTADTIIRPGQKVFIPE